MGLGIKTFLIRHWTLWRHRDQRFQIGYDEWREKRIQAIIRQYGREFFRGKTLLEVGSGFGDIGAAFAALGAQVTCLEGRKSNVESARKKYPHLKTIHWDLERGLAPLAGQIGDTFDMIIHMGVLYHLPDPDKSLREACFACTHMVLETEVCDSDDPGDVPRVKEDRLAFDQALHGTGSRPSPAFIERVMSECGMRFQKITDARCNAGGHVYDWPAQNTKTFRAGLRRMWFGERICSMRLAPPSRPVEPATIRR